ncbi:hypothetical protein [Streptomyces sp. VRA16 Mangrove soil]|uniref:hypothetical protein n=1 Tax=Streptomyces sp. VRA16 Mangrove soil TaxID=2817434 RepID=UPI001A9FFAA1|nr:hypothetical protein [Streptomyces sp. VRA16 Mangrove soil]MBO1333924.1 hypothetical protein [Streptomyces sp. VRA16 Mangrove soil]
MPASITEEADRLLVVTAISAEPPTPSQGDAPLLLNCPSCGSSHVAQMLGDNGGISYVCTACGHSWS